MSFAPPKPTWASFKKSLSAVVSRGRRKIIWKFAACLLLAALGVDGFFIEPYRIEVTHYAIPGNVSAPLKIAHLSDLHAHGLGRRERRLLAVLAAEKPDLIVITGDTLGNRRGNYQDCRRLYRELHAPLGVWFVRGNWENLKPLRHERAFYESVGVHLLLNANREVRPGVWIAGVDDPYTGTARLETALAGIPASAYTIALFHSPAFFDRIAGRVNPCLAGHTHGGQVRVPLLKPLWLPKGCGRFLEGWYAERGSRMYVSRGLGMSILPVRLLCRPEITFITVEPAGPEAGKSN